MMTTPANAEYLYQPNTDQQPGEDDETYLCRLWLLRRHLAEERVDVDSFRFPHPFKKTDGHVRAFMLWQIDERIRNIDKVLNGHRFPAVNESELQQNFQNCTLQEIAIWVFLGEIRAYKDRCLSQPVSPHDIADQELKGAVAGRFFDPLEVRFFDPCSKASQGRWLTYEQLVARWTRTGRAKSELEALIWNKHEEIKNPEKPERRGMAITHPDLNPSQFYAFYPPTQIADRPEEGMFNLRQIEAFEKVYYGAEMAAKLSQPAGDNQVSESESADGCHYPKFTYADSTKGRGDFGKCIRHRLLEWARKHDGASPSRIQLKNYMETHSCDIHDVVYRADSSCFICAGGEINIGAYNKHYERLKIKIDDV